MPENKEAMIEQTSKITNLSRHLSAEKTIYRRQGATGLIVLSGWIALIVANPSAALGLFMILVALLTVIISIYVTVMAYQSFNTSDNPSILARPPSEEDQKLPTYTVLVPLYHESRLIPDLIDALVKLEYPVEHLEIFLLLETDDPDTQMVLRTHDLPSHFEIVVVPPGYPKTKARACNYGLRLAKGEYLTIYDAEDRPESDQLLKSLRAFQEMDPKVVCIQCQLNYYNLHQNLWTRLYAIEQAVWYDLVLPGLAHIWAPIPLSGTSNHFRTSHLKLIGGWDDFNVTEDCDIGIRLAAAGYQTKVLHSTTWEEANSKIRNWLRQRSRWLKGHFQTYLVHMRSPITLLKSLGLRNFVIFQISIGAAPWMILSGPLVWLILIGGVLAKLLPIQAISIDPFGSWWYSLGLLALFSGNMLFIGMSFLGIHTQNRSDLYRYLPLLPVYWSLQSIAAWMGVYQLITRPHYWEKTEHGLDKSNSV